MSTAPISPQVKDSIANSVLCWLATIDPDGWPTVSPKQIWGWHDDTTLVVADIASPGSVRNIRHMGRACVSFLDIFRQKGFKLIGTAQVVTPQDDSYAALARPLIDAAGDRFTLRHVIVLKVDKAVPIIAPSYALYNATEAQMQHDAYMTYGVIPQPAEPQAGPVTRP